MCGIAGIVRFDDRPIDADRLGAMLAHLKHRGPDGDGISHHDRCALVHARLAIIDLLSGASRCTSTPRPLMPIGPKPRARVLCIWCSTARSTITSPCGPSSKSVATSFSTDHSDTEVLLFGYRQWGENLPKHLHGMFAFAIWDAEQRSMFMARDRAGLKPLYLRSAPTTAS